MRTKNALLIALVVVLPFLLTAPQALAQRGCQTPTGTVFDEWVDPQAPGTKLYGTLAIYYQKVCSESMDCCLGNGSIGTKMFFVLRLSKGNDLYVFAGDSGTELVCYVDMTRQKEILFDFFQANVLPVVSPSSSNFALKAVDQVVDTHDAASTFYFTMLDITLAVQN
jgi:hypothetical protein